MPSIYYDSLGLNEDAVMDLSMLEATGSVTHDESKSHIMATLHNGIVWNALATGHYGLSMHELMSRYLDAPAADTAALNFTSGDYSLAVWIRPSHWIDDDMNVMGKYAVNVRGWELYRSEYGGIDYMTLRHHHGGGATTRTASYSVGWARDGVYRLFSVSRIGATAQHYMNGQPITTSISVGGLIDPDSSVASDLTIGCRYSKDDHFWTGALHRPRAWARALTADEHRQWYDHGAGWW